MAILSALPQEQRGLMGWLQRPRKVLHARRDFWLGDWHGQPVGLALSNIGKVAAAATHHDSADRAFWCAAHRVTGVAGELGRGVKVGDVVVATDFVQHDLDASPLFPATKCRCTGKPGFTATRS